MYRMKTCIATLLLLLATSWATARTHARPLPQVPDSIAVPDTADAEVAEPFPEDHRPLSERLRSLLENDIFDRTQVGLYVYDLTADTLVLAYHERQCMRPASNEKLVTAITALSTLGTDYEYETRLLADAVPTDSVFTGRLYIRGGYDPLLDRDDLRAMADSLLAFGVRRLAGAVWLDRSMKDDKQWGWEWCWDDKEVPLDPLLCHNRADFADRLRQVFAEKGIAWDGTVQDGTAPQGLTTLCVRRHTLDAVLLPMMKQSDNSMAESVFYQLAAHGGQRHAGRKQAVRHIERLVREVGLEPDHYQFADGSGLSLYNYLTPQLLGRLLRYAYAHEPVYRHLLPTLPVAGEDGTLRKRMRGTEAAGNVQAKTGTVEGVSTLSGYCTAANGNRLCFSIMNQGIRHTSTGRRFQDRLCRELCR